MLHVESLNKKKDEIIKRFPDVQYFINAWEFFPLVHDSTGGIAKQSAKALRALSEDTDPEKRSTSLKNAVQLAHAIQSEGHRTIELKVANSLRKPH